MDAGPAIFALNGIPAVAGRESQLNGVDDRGQNGRSNINASVKGSVYVYQPTIPSRKVRLNNVVLLCWFSAFATIFGDAAARKLFRCQEMHGSTSPLA